MDREASLCLITIPVARNALSTRSDERRPLFAFDPAGTLAGVLLDWNAVVHLVNPEDLAIAAVRT